MRSLRLVFSLLLIAAPACSTVSLGDEEGDAGGGDDASAKDGGPVGPVGDGGRTGPTDAATDATTATTATTDAAVDAADAAPSPDAAPDAAVDAAGDAATDAGDGGASPFWVVEDAGTTDALYAVGGSGPNDVYIGSNKGVYHSKGDGVWTLEPVRLPVLSISAAAPGRIYTSGEFGLVDEGSGNGTWNELTACNKPTQHAPPTGPSGEGDVAASGTTLYYTFIGAGDYGTGVCTWTQDETDAGTYDVTWYDNPAVIDDVFTSDTGQAYIVGSDATGTAFVAARSGATWTKIAPDPAGESAPSSAFLGGVALGSSFWVVNDSEVWSGTVGGDFTLFQGYGLDRLFGIWSGAANDLWVVANGNHPEVVHQLLGANPVIESLPQSPGILTAIWGSGGTDLYAVGENGAILHRKGS
jgi:hypothetical protein